MFFRLYKEDAYDENSVAFFVNNQFENAMDSLDKDTDSMACYVSGGYHHIDEKDAVTSVTKMFLDKVVNNPFAAALRECYESEKGI